MSEEFCRIYLIKGTQTPGILIKDLRIFRKENQSKPIIVIDYPICESHLQIVEKCIEKFGWIKKEGE